MLATVVDKVKFNASTGQLIDDGSIDTQQLTAPCH